MSMWSARVGSRTFEVAPSRLNLRAVSAGCRATMYVTSRVVVGGGGDDVVDVGDVTGWRVTTCDAGRARRGRGRTRAWIGTSISV